MTVKQFLNQVKKVLIITVFTILLLLAISSGFIMKHWEYQWCLSSGASESYCRWQSLKRR